MTTKEGKTMAKQRLYEYTVKGRGSFPEDMLRYDYCNYASDQDKALAETGRGIREVHIIGQCLPTRGRWNSFLWKVI